MSNNQTNENKNFLKPEDVMTEEDLKKYLRQRNHPLAEKIIKAREETIRIFGRLLTEEEIKEFISDR